MSANNVIYLNKDTFEVGYQGCVDNEGYGEFQKKCKSLEEAVELVDDLTTEYEPEYGIMIIKNIIKNIKGDKL